MYKNFKKSVIVIKHYVIARTLGCVVISFLLTLDACGDDSSSNIGDAKELDGASQENLVCRAECEKGEIRDDRDGHIYGTVRIGEQVWLSENLVFKAHNSGCFDNDEKNCNQYGRLYTWASAMGRTEDECGVEKLCNQVEEPYRGICPEGFHIPSVAEFEQLSKYVRDCGKSGNLFLSLAHKLNASLQYNLNEYIDEFSFGAFLGGYGYRTMDDTASTLWPSYLKFMDQTIFWTIDQLGTPKPNVYAWMWYMFVDSMEFKSSYDRKDEGFSIRCLKD